MKQLLIPCSTFACHHSALIYIGVSKTRSTVSQTLYCLIDGAKVSIKKTTIENIFQKKFLWWIWWIYFLFLVDTFGGCPLQESYFFVGFIRFTGIAYLFSVNSFIIASAMRLYSSHICGAFMSDKDHS